MAPIFAFDIYGTLVDPLKMSVQLTRHVGDRAGPLTELWRSKQLEYSFRRGLMVNYKTFSGVTKDALDFACRALGINLPEDVIVALMDQYRALDAFEDVRPALSALETKGARLHAFSNGQVNEVAALLAHAQIDDFIESIVSADDVQTFKPDPRVYAHFNTVTGTTPKATWLVSTNPFDIIGAAAFGWNTAWVKRSPAAVFDPWEHSPTKTIASLKELVSLCPKTD